MPRWRSSRTSWCAAHGAALRSLCAATLLLSASGCATTKVAPIGPAQLEEDERYIWKRSVEMQRMLDRSGLLYADPELSAYLNDVARRLVSEDLAGAGMEPRVRVLSDVDMNAFSFATGSVYLHSAILARMDNEAQLALLLGHEFAHTIHRHALRAHRDLKNKTAFLSTVTTVAGAVPYGGLASTLVQLGGISSIFGYSRSLEREADLKGLEQAARAGYDVEEASKLFQNMLDYQQELEEQGIERDHAPYFFSTHPRLKERVESCRELVRERYRDGISGTPRIRNQKAFAAQVEGVTVQQAALEVDAGRHRSARITIERVLARNSRNAEAWLTLGEALQGQEKQEQRHQALAAFRKALALDPELGGAHRALGMAFYSERESEETPSRNAARALSHFERYLELEPGAIDRGYVEAYIRELRSLVPTGSGEKGSGP